MIVGFPPGGFNDTTARLINAWLSEHLGQQFVTENRRNRPSVQRPNPAGGSRSSTARIRRPVSGPYVGKGRDGFVRQSSQALAGKSAAPAAHRPRHGAEARDRARRTPLGSQQDVRARKTSRCSVVGARTRASSTARSRGDSRTSAALGSITILNHESALRKSGY
jgi:hypothetical protein